MRWEGLRKERAKWAASSLYEAAVRLLCFHTAAADRSSSELP